MTTHNRKQQLNGSKATSFKIGLNSFIQSSKSVSYNIIMLILLTLFLTSCSNTEHMAINQNIATIIQNQRATNDNLQIIVDNQVIQNNNLKILEENIINGCKN